uniref:Protein kinase domain-containing protein n=1 Tax=Salix viminalis TaxID=40686 RepID=A0A6N2M5N3_SALVM
MEPPPQIPPQLQRTTSISTTLLNKYELGRLLGRGSFAKVYAARSLSDKTQLVAIKIIDKTKTDAAMEPRIISEISAMHRLQHHPNVLKIHEVMATKTKIYLVMELASGGDLFSKIQKMGKLKEPAARRYFQQLVSAIHFCHQNGVSHRDIKPHNLLLDGKGNLKISDFGLSALKNGGVDVGFLLQTACGTPAFTAPEVMARRGYDGSKADAWKIHKGEYQLPSCLKKPVKSIINQLLEPNPNKRMSIEALMNHPWFLKRVGFVRLFEVKYWRGGRFTSSETVERVAERVREVGGRLGYSVEEGKGGVLEIVEKLMVVEIKVVEGGGVEFEDLHWEN